MGGSTAGAGAGGWSVVIGIGGGLVAVGGLLGFASSHRKAHRERPPEPPRAEVVAPAPPVEARPLPGLADALPEADVEPEVAVDPVVETELDPLRADPAPVVERDDLFDPFAGFHLPSVPIVEEAPAPYDALDGPFRYRSATFDASAGVDLTDREGVRLRIPPNAVVDRLGSPVTEPVTVSWTLVNDKAQLEHMPVPLETVVEGERKMLQSFGMLDVSLVAGEELAELVEPAEISWPLAGRPGRFPPGSTAPLYEMNEIGDRWERRGNGRVIDERFVAVVPNRGTWNCDDPIENTGCVRGRLVAKKAFELPDDALVSVSGAEPSLWQTHVQPTPAGDFCANAYPSDPSEVKAYTSLGSRCFKTVALGQVQASPAGSNCASTRSECAVVDILVEETPCTGPFVSLADRRGYGTLEIAVPPSVEHVVVDCPPVFRDALRPVDGKVSVERVPASAQCHVDLDLGSRVYRMDTINGAQSWTCTDKGRFTCTGPPKRDIELSKLSRTEPILIHEIQTVASAAP